MLPCLIESLINTEPGKFGSLKRWRSKYMSCCSSFQTPQMDLGSFQVIKATITPGVSSIPTGFSRASLSNIARQQCNVGLGRAPPRRLIAILASGKSAMRRPSMPLYPSHLSPDHHMTSRSSLRYKEYNHATLIPEVSSMRPFDFTTPISISLRAQCFPETEMSFGDRREG